MAVFLEGAVAKAGLARWELMAPADAHRREPRPEVRVGMNEDYFAVALPAKESVAEGVRRAVALFQARHGRLPSQASMRADLAMQVPEDADMEIVIDERVALGSVYFRVSGPA
jgi:hypothetical protein